MFGHEVVHNRRFPFRWRWGILAVLLVFIWVARGDVGIGEGYARTVYPTLARGLSGFSSLFPFSIGDCFIYGSIIGLLGYLFYAITRRKGIWRTLRRSVEYLAWVYVWFYLAWGLNYFREDFYARAGVEPVRFSEDPFVSFLEAYTDSLNASWIAPVDTVDQEIVRRSVLEGYRTLPDRFGLIEPTAYMRPKTMLFSRLMSAVGVSGYMGPFFTEFHLNGLLHPVQYPATYAHEMAHVLGVSNEAEANLYSYLVCVASPDPAVRFSGYFALFPHVLRNAHRLLEKDTYNKWIKNVRPEIKTLYNEEVAYWRSLYSPLIGEAQDVVYNLFLKGNKISSGTANYSEVIRLLMALREEDHSTSSK